MPTACETQARGMGERVARVLEVSNFSYHAAHFAHETGGNYRMEKNRIPQLLRLGF
jgi:hypothetical protein